MKRKLLLIGSLSVIFCLLVVSVASATSIAFRSQGAKLSGAPDYHWWYGCSATSAGMMMAYYDIHGYGGLEYDNLVPGGDAELDTYPNTPYQWDYLAQSAIASQGHVDAFYGGGYGASGDDLPRDSSDFDSLADFMGTSQDSAGQSNGSTGFNFFTNGARFYADDAYDYGVWDSDGMYGMWEYFDYAGYGSGSGNGNTNFFTQLTDNLGLQYGFDFDDYRAEIDAGRVVMLHVDGHSMFGYGYEDDGTVYLHDTWNPQGEHTMMWGGFYDSREMWGVTCFTPTGGTEPGSGVIPEPGTIFLLGFGLLGLLGAVRKRMRK